MIKSFADKLTAAVFANRMPKGFPVDVLKSARGKLAILDAAIALDELKSPLENHLEALKVDRKGQYSIRINDQGRICFIWRADGPHEVEIVDYH